MTTERFEARPQIACGNPGSQVAPGRLACGTVAPGLPQDCSSSQDPSARPHAFGGRSDLYGGDLLAQLSEQLPRITELARQR